MVPDRAKLKDYNDMDSTLIDSQRLAESIIVDELLAKWKGFRNLKRVEAYNALDDERKYQEALNPGGEPLSGELALLKVYLDKAFVAFAETFGDPKEIPTMDVIRKIGAICLRAMENHGSVMRKII